MDQSTYTQLSGIVPDSTRFTAIAEIAKARLERMLGYPLDPGDWDNQYIEIGKALNECSCPALVSTENLDDPDEVVGAYRLFPYRPSDVYIAIDPATAIHAVKFVRTNVTYRELDEGQYRIQWQNATTPFTRYLMVKDQCLCSCNCSHWDTDYTYQVAVDADWAFEETPVELNLVYSQLITDGLDKKGNIKSESITSHSYTKFDKGTDEQLYGSVLSSYAGPNGAFKRRVT